MPSTVFSGAFSPDTAHTPPQADPRLSPLWRLGEPMFPVHLWTWREPEAMALEAELCPWRWGLFCLWPFQVIPGAEAQDVTLQMAVAPDSRES